MVKRGGGDNLAVNPNTTKIYVTSFYSSGGNIVLYLIDRSNPKDAKTIEIPVDGNGVKDVIVNPKTNDIYFINGVNDTAYYIRVMDGYTNKKLKNISLPGILDQENQADNSLMAINPNTNRLYVDDNSGLNIMDTSTNKIIGSLKEINGSNSIVDSNINKIYTYKILPANTTSNGLVYKPTTDGYM